MKKSKGRAGRLMKREAMDKIVYRLFFSVGNDLLLISD